MPAASGSTTAAAVGSAAPAASGPGLAKPLRGPFATIDAYCATRPTGADLECLDADVAPKGGLPAGLLEAAIVYDNNDSPNHDIGCAIALRTSAGWFVGPPSADICREPSYIELEGVDVDTSGAIAAITLDGSWHTKDFDREAKFTLSALCGVRGGIPACTSVFLSQCDKEAPACGDSPFARTWTLDGDTATFTPDPTLDDDAGPTGKHTILGG